MDPLSDVLSLLKPRNYMSAGFDAAGDWSIQFPDQQEGIKCYAVVSGQCWLSVEGVPEPVRLETGDCFLLPSGRPFRLASDLTLPPVEARTVFSAARSGGIVSWNGGGDFLLVGSRFALDGNHAGILLRMLPPIVHIRKESDKAALRWSVERMMQELRERAAGRLSGRPAPRPHDAGSGPAAASGGRGERRRRLALRSGGQADGRGDQRHARRSGASLDIAGAGGARRHVALDLRPEIQGDGRGVADGIPDALAHAAGRGQAGEFQRSHFRHCALARLRIRKRLQHRLQEGHGLFAAAIWPGPDSGFFARRGETPAPTGSKLSQVNHAEADRFPFAASTSASLRTAASAISLRPSPRWALRCSRIWRRIRGSQNFVT